MKQGLPSFHPARQIFLYNSSYNYYNQEVAGAVMTPPRDHSNASSEELLP
jgi:hypothetical protein